MKTRSTNKPSDQKRRIFLIDDHEVMREGLKRLLQEESDLVVCGEAENSRKAITGLEKALPDLAIVDISMPGASGLELIKNLKARFPDLKMIVLSMHDEALYAERVLRAGASGYVMKHVSTSQLLSAVRAVLREEIYLSAPLSSQLLQSLTGRRTKASDAFDRLSDREFEILRLVGEGYTTREVASSLGISSKTVESHRGNMRQKLKLKTGAELIRFAISHRENARFGAQQIA
jgi:DNA-binding NarL/FixJ family response regulator